MQCIQKCLSEMPQNFFKIMNSCLKYSVIRATVQCHLDTDMLWTSLGLWPESSGGLHMDSVDFPSRDPHFCLQLLHSPAPCYLNTCAGGLRNPLKQVSGALEGSSRDRRGKKALILLAFSTELHGWVLARVFSYLFQRVLIPLQTSSKRTLFTSAKSQQGHFQRHYLLIRNWKRCFLDSSQGPSGSMGRI